MSVQLFGKVDSPSIANWTVKQCVKDSNNRFSNSTEKRVLENFYMDDFLPSASTSKELSQTAIEVAQMLKEGGYSTAEMAVQRSRSD